MRQRQLRRKTMVEYYVGDTLNGTVSANRDHGYRKWMVQRSIDSNKSFRASAEEHPAVFFNQIFPSPMMYGEIKISRFHEMIADAAHHLIVVTLAQVRHQDPYT